MDDQTKLVELLYDSVIDEAQWPVALQPLADFTSGHGVFHVAADPRSGTIVQQAHDAADVRPQFGPRYLLKQSAKMCR